MRNLRWVSIGLFAFLAVLAQATGVRAQGGPGFGIGPRMTFQSGDDAVPDSSALRILGGQVKLRLTPKTAIELAAQYESSLNDNLTERVKSLPFQASVLVFPLRSVVSPYVLGGLGWYSQSITSASGASGAAGATASIREMGYHGGVGAEVQVGRRLAIHGDYRFTHIRFGGDDSAGTPAATSASRVPGITALQESLKMSHQGSMWNWGATFFF